MINSENNHLIFIKRELRKLSNKKIAEHSQRFFKTGKGQYGEGDKFLGIRVPILRQMAKEHNNISINDTFQLLNSHFHEERLFALLKLIQLYKKASNGDKKKIYTSYLENTKFINNWDLVDCSAEHIVGAYLYLRDKKPIYDLAYSQSLWERRISIMSTFHYIKRNKFSDTLSISEILLYDKHDLIHKSVGWMLREVGKRDREREEKFLRKYYRDMPRTMLRYAIEKFPTQKRKMYLKGEIY